MIPRRIIIRDDANNCWQSLSSMQSQKSCSGGDFSSVIAWAEEQALAGFWVCGYLYYEASAAEPESVSQDTDTIPSVWFGAFSEAQEVADPAIAASQPVVLPEFQATLSHEQYQRRFLRVKEYLASGDSYQVNLTFRLHTTYSDDCYRLFCQLCANQAGRYAAYLEFAEMVILSASPELFFQRDGARITTRPMKGTIARGTDANDDARLAQTLCNDAKNQAENIMIVDMIRNDLGQFADTGSVRVPQLFQVETYPHIQQMTSTVTAESTKPLAPLMRALFPCASITGAPKARTMSIISELETSKRELYTGSVGFIRPGGDCQFNVAIRTAHWQADNNTLSFGVGSGVVWDSDGVDEYAECRLKANILQKHRPLGLIETLYWDRQNGYRNLDGHRDRLQRSAFELGIVYDAASFCACLESVIELDAARVRIHLSAAGQFTRTLAALPQTPEFITLALCPWPVDRHWPLLQHKVDRRDLYERAQAAVSCDQTLLWNEQGDVTESVYANLVIREGDCWFTPPLSDGLLPGVMRAALLETAVLQEQSIDKQRLRAADEIWLISSLRGWCRARLLD